MSSAPPLDATRWRRIADCFERALDCPEGARESLVREALADDPTAADEVLAMLGTTAGDQALSIEPRLLVAEDEVALTGQRLGPYRVGPLIGRGGMGEVYRGDREDGAFEQAVAIKVMRHGAYARELVQRFEAERRILARLAHPGIVSILDGGTTADRRPYLVMPHVEGLPITLWANERRLGLDERLRLFVRAADIVQYAHAQLVVHRDLKPSNIFVTADGSIALLDFGIARLLDPTTGESDGHTLASPLRLLTPEHAAPEQVRGERAGVAADVYALGVLLYELVTGVRPHIRGNRTLAELEQEILEVAPNAPSAAGWNMPWKRRLRGDLERIIQMALRKEPARRYASAAQLAADVERFLEGLPVRATADSFGYRLRRFLHRHRFGVSIGAVVLVALLVLTGQAMWQSRRAARERDAARRAERTTNEVVAMLTSLFEQANPMLRPGGDTVRVGDLLSSAQAKVDSLAGDPRTQAQLQVVLGEMHMARGRADEAAPLFRRAATTLAREPVPDSLLLARATIGLARAVDSYEGRLQALPLFEAAVRWHERAFGPTALETDVVRREYAAADTAVARRQRAIESMVADSALATVTDTMNRAERIHALGVQRYRAGDIIAARPLFEEALRLVELKLPPTHPTRWLVMGTVAAARQKSGDFAQAEAMARALRDEQAARVPLNAVGLAHATEFLAVTLSARGFFEEAEARQREAVRLWRSALAPRHPSQSNALAVLAMIRSARGAHDEARALLDSAAALIGAGAPEDRLALSGTQVDAMLRAGRLPAALAELTRTAPAVAAYPLTHTLRSGHAWRLAVTTATLGQYDASAAALDQVALGIGPTVPAAHPWHRGVACLRAWLTVQSVRTDATAQPRSLNPEAAAACAAYTQFGVGIPLPVRGE